MKECVRKVWNNPLIDILLPNCFMPIFTLKSSNCVFNLFINFFLMVQQKEGISNRQTFWFVHPDFTTLLKQKKCTRFLISQGQAEFQFFSPKISLNWKYPRLFACFRFNSWRTWSTGSAAICSKGKMDNVMTMSVNAPCSQGSRNAKWL